MKPATTPIVETPAVQVDGDLLKAIEAANERAAEVYSSGKNTLIDQISLEDWATWDASDDLALICAPEDCDDDFSLSGKIAA